MKTIREIFKENLISLRGKRSLKEVSATSGIAYRTLQNMEDGVIPQDETLLKIAQYYAVPQTRFFLDADLLPKAPPSAEALLETVTRQQEEVRQLRERLKQFEEQNSQMRERLTEIQSHQAVAEILALGNLSEREQNSLFGAIDRIQFMRDPHANRRSNDRPEADGAAAVPESLRSKKK